MTTASYATANTAPAAAASRPFTFYTLVDVLRCAFEMKAALGVDSGIVPERTVARLRRIAAKI